MEQEKEENSTRTSFIIFTLQKIFNYLFTYSLTTLALVRATERRNIGWQ